MLVSGSYFPLLGVRRRSGGCSARRRRADRRALRGRAQPRYWENELGADPGVLNQTIVVNGSR
jgi:hypothetical protein